ncbi:MAG: UDP-N-acetylmuramoyl-L-alanine--D-glutamate ligase [Myxococcota bacterium]
MNDVIDLGDKKVLVVGLGASGLAAARLLADEGARVVVNDSREASALGDRLDALPAGVELALGGHDPALFRRVDLIVLSPGVPPLPALDAADAVGVPVWSEVELASRVLHGDLVAVTGTNGKSTVTSLLGAIFEAAADGRPGFLGGNLGTPLTEAVRTAAAGPEGRVALEVSSFQLERVDRFRPDVAVLTNLAEDHLDRYPSMAAYAAAKGRIFGAQRREDHAVVPEGDALAEGLAAAGAAAVHRFGGTRGAVHVEGEHIVGEGLRVPLSALRLVGAHNHLNACCAALAARLAGLGTSAIAAGLAAFTGLPHRMAFVAELDGVRFYDDSKATNVGAAVAALRGFAGDPSFRGEVVLLAGGKDKGGSYAPLREALGGVRAVVTLGEAAGRIEEALAFEPTVRAGGDDPFADAVAKARELARPGDAVLLAPACSSFDMFRSYVARGLRFQELVRAMALETHSGEVMP